jgi:hypothetical protein
MIHIKNYKKFINENNNDYQDDEIQDEIQDDEIFEPDDEIQDEIQDDEIFEPDDDDCFINCNGWDYNVSIEGKHIGKFVEIEDAEDAIRTWAKKNKWYPACWFISDHGNISSHEMYYQL